MTIPEILGLAVQATITAETLTFVYDEMPRTVEVHAVGLSQKDGALVIRGFQVGGETSRAEMGWSLFRGDKMTEVSLTSTPLSQAPRPGYKTGDKQMAAILAEVPL